MAVYDFLPDALLSEIENLAEFAGVLAFDKWSGNADARQAIFFRARLREPKGGKEVALQGLGFAGQMIDNGYVFEGPNWGLTDSPVQGAVLPAAGIQSRTWVDGF